MQRIRDEDCRGNFVRIVINKRDDVMNRRMKKKVEKRKAEAAKVASTPKVVKAAKPAVKPVEKTVKAAVTGEVQLLVSKKVHLYVAEKGKAACGAAQGTDTEIRSGAAEEVTCKLCQRSLNK